ncbi:translation elongation factor EF-1, subunit alpha [Spizellomyces punctatus DAOM BR117]|uniref:Elongation factor 1 alpha-like protein n=1 Tax=Spizellomyces punctatus (strain DAOM BR117) TaxID=645134 RepID=A0A0L0HDZ3_SPIPD|nr:translation elongation factor EF-1, subunit alpha [Spizellomyces punctatus DAOM BR117]KNC99194.1 translation elongation factor EF-1, subunit alpha [Spizellomyces punctatus DAOM BR117]|eukprot:XP_016607234.1 translation elongation factor EF-1, subunit alpha [Spizellomyces punctatus DAOM BR117]
MSRHRNIRNINLDDELDEDYDDDDYYDEEEYDGDYTYEAQGGHTVASFIDTEQKPVTETRGAINLVEEVRNIVGDDFPTEQISDVLQDSGNDIERAVNLLYDQGPRIAPPPGFPVAPPPGFALKSDSRQPASRIAGLKSDKTLTIIQAEEDGVAFRTAYPVTVEISKLPLKDTGTNSQKRQLVDGIESMESDSGKTIDVETSRSPRQVEQASTTVPDIKEQAGQTTHSPTDSFRLIDARSSAKHDAVSATSSANSMYGSLPAPSSLGSSLLSSLPASGQSLAPFAFPQGLAGAPPSEQRAKETAVSSLSQAQPLSSLLLQSPSSNLSQTNSLFPLQPQGTLLSSLHQSTSSLTKSGDAIGVLGNSLAPENAVKSVPFPVPAVPQSQSLSSLLSNTRSPSGALPLSSLASVSLGNTMAATPLSLSNLSSLSGTSGLLGATQKSSINDAPGLSQLASNSANIMSGTDAIRSALAAFSLQSAGNASEGSLGTVPAASTKEPLSVFPTPFKTLPNSGIGKPDAETSIPFSTPKSQPVRLPTTIPLRSSKPRHHSDANDDPLVAAPSTFAQFFTHHENGDKTSAISNDFLSSPFVPADDVAPFAFDAPSPDDVVNQARSKIGPSGKSAKLPSSKPTPQIRKKQEPIPEPMDQLQMDLSGLNLAPPKSATLAPPPAMARTVSASSSNSSLAPPAMARTGSSSSTGRSSPKLKRINVAEEYKKRNAEKESLNLVVVGHVDAGKSTLMGHVLYLLGEVNERTMKKYERDAEKMKKSSFAYAWVLDETEEERTRGVTIDVAITKFHTPHRKFTLLDAPGHRDFIPNMMSGAAQADVAILVVDATPGEFETGFDSGGQTREHAVLLRSLGVTQLIVAVNKLDVVDWSKTRFDEISEKLSHFLSQVGFRKQKVAFIPTSGYTGENLVKRESDKLNAWYSGSTLVEQIDAFEAPQRAVDKPFRLSIADYFKGGIGAGGGGAVSVSGRIEAGGIQVGEVVLVMPINEYGTVRALEVSEEAVKWAAAGDSVLMSLTGVEIAHINVGSILCDPSAPVAVTSHFRAQIVTFDIQIPLTIGVPVVLHHQSLTEQSTITKLSALLNKSTGETIKKNPRALPKNVTAVVEIKTSRPICLETFKDSKELGRFMLRAGPVTVAAGIVLEILSFERGLPVERT